MKFRQPEKRECVIARRQLAVSGFTAYGYVVTRVRSTRGNPRSSNRGNPVKTAGFNKRR